MSASKVVIGSVGLVGQRGQAEVPPAEKRLNTRKPLSQ